MFEFLLNLSRLTRPLSNIKNIAIIFFAFFLVGGSFNLPDFLISIVSLSFICSAMYTFNTLSDLNSDGRNKNKEHYTEAVDYFGKSKILVILIILVVAGLALGYYINLYFVYSLISLLIVGFLYSSSLTRFKEKVFLDVIFGAVMTYPLRFIAAWFIFSSSFPPLFPIISLAFAKAGGYMMYKELDRPFLVSQGIRSSITSLSKRANIVISTIFWFLSVVAFLLMCLASKYFRTEIWGYLPLKFLFLLPLVIPAIIVMYLKALGRIKIRSNRLRTIGLVYFILAIGVALFI